MIFTLKCEVNNSVGDCVTPSNASNTTDINTTSSSGLIPGLDMALEWTQALISLLHWEK